MAFTEIADRVWVARYEWFDVNVTLVGGDRGLLVVDTHASDLAARAVDRRRTPSRRRRGASRSSTPTSTSTTPSATARSARRTATVPIHAHEVAAEQTVPAGERIKALYDADADDPHRDEVAGDRDRAADHTFSSAVALDLGDRLVELVHPGRGHTGGDLVLRVPDVDVLLAGDLVEESMARNGVPGFGGDCYPLEWPHSLDIVLSLSTSATVVVPGHGAPVDREFVEEQRNAIGIVAQTIRDLAARGVPASDALAAAEWPYPREELAAAVRRGTSTSPAARSGCRSSERVRARVMSD